MSLKRTTPLRRGKSELKRGTGLKAKKRINPINRKRIKVLRAKQFGEGKSKWIETLPCLLCGKMGVDVHHHPTRGAGGTMKDTIPLCRICHNSYHVVGAATFQARHNLDLRAEAEHYHRAWLLRGAA